MTLRQEDTGQGGILHTPHSALCLSVGLKAFF